LILKNDPSGSIVSQRSSHRKSLNNEVIDEEEASNNEEDEKNVDAPPENLVPKA